MYAMTFQTLFYKKGEQERNWSSEILFQIFTPPLTKFLKFIIFSNLFNNS